MEPAGLREDGGVVEREGMRRALRRAEAVDLILWLSPVTESVGIRPDGFDSVPTWEVATKGDLVGNWSSGDQTASDTIVNGRVMVSAMTGEGIDVLVEAIALLLGGMDAGIGAADALPSRERHRAGVRDTREWLARGVGSRGRGLEFVAENWRRAGDDLGRIVGVIGVEDLLDDIFGSFCIGK